MEPVGPARSRPVSQNCCFWFCFGAGNDTFRSLVSRRTKIVSAPIPLIINVSFTLECELLRLGLLKSPFWTALWNEDKIFCSDSDCVGKVVWQSSSGSAYDEHIPDHKLLIKGYRCTRMKNATVIESKNCHHKNTTKYVCEFACPQPTAATPSPVTDEEAPTGMQKKGV